MVIIDLPTEQNLVVVEGWVTDIEERQYVRLSRSNSFSGAENPPIEDATVVVDVRNRTSISYSHISNGRYLPNEPFSGEKGEQYRVTIILAEGDLIRSGWSTMSPRTRIVLLSIDNFEENDPENPGTTKTVFFPRITARDSADFDNFYRWLFYKDNNRMTEPESITLQKDIFFDGNFIPNLFDQFEYDVGEEIRIELHSIEEASYDYLSLLKSQTTTLGGAASTTPAIVNGNVLNLSSPEETVLGFFGTTSISADSTIIE